MQKGITGTNIYFNCVFAFSCIFLISDLCLSSFFLFFLLVFGFSSLECLYLFISVLIFRSMRLSLFFSLLWFEFLVLSVMKNCFGLSFQIYWCLYRCSLVSLSTTMCFFCLWFVFLPSHFCFGVVCLDGTVSWFLDWVRVLFVLVLLGHWFFATRDSGRSFLPLSVFVLFCFGLV